LPHVLVPSHGAFGTLGGKQTPKTRATNQPLDLSEFGGERPLGTSEKGCTVSRFCAGFVQASNQVRARREIRPPVRRMPNRLDLDLDRRILPKASLIFKINLITMIQYPTSSLNTVPDNFLLLHEDGLEDFARCPLGPSRPSAETSHFQRARRPSSSFSTGTLERAVRGPDSPKAVRNCGPVQRAVHWVASLGTQCG
jgi:hypothetical protein